MKKNAHIAGYTLTELSFVLAIIGVVVGMSLSVGTTQYELTKISNTKQNLEIIREALLLYRDKQRRFPCPAFGADAPEDATYGEEVVGCDDATCPAGLVCQNNAVIGTVPFKEINVSEKVAIDDWDHKITYVVDKTHVTVSGYSNGSIPVEDGDGNEVTASPSLGDAIFVLVSHGDDGSGAWPHRGGTQIACPVGQRDSGNCDETDDIFIDRRFNNSDVVAEYFDDLVAFQTQDFLDEYYFVAPTGDAAPAGAGYFIMIGSQADGHPSLGTYNGNKGGLAGGNAQCLEALTTLDWKGKQDATDRGLLVASKIKWFQCDTSTCQLPEPDTTYQYGLADYGDASYPDPTVVGGDTFTTNGSGQGPGNLDAWNVITKFGNDQGEFQSNIGADSPTLWSTTPRYTTNAETCNGWTTDSSNQGYPTGDWDNNPGGSTRWANWVDPGTPPPSGHDCGDRRSFICIVNP